jgi:hypothetical protein
MRTMVPPKLISSSGNAATGRLTRLTDLPGVRAKQSASAGLQKIGRFVIQDSGDIDGSRDAGDGYPYNNERRLLRSRLKTHNGAGFQPLCILILISWAIPLAGMRPRLRRSNCHKA